MARLSDKHVCVKCGRTGVDKTGVCPRCGPTQVVPLKYWEATEKSRGG